MKFAEYNNSVWVELTFKHDINHTSYFSILVPDEVRQFIEENQQLPMRDVVSFRIRTVYLYSVLISR